MAKKYNEGEMRVWLSNKAHQMLGKICSRELRTYKTQLEIIIEAEYKRISAKDKAKRERKRKCKD